MLYLRDIEVDVHVRCRACGHEGVLPRADMNRRFGPNYPVLSIAPHYRCSRCNSRDTESRPAPPPFSTPVTATSSQEDAPSFAAPLAALQGLLDAMRGRGDAMDGPEEDAAPVPAAPLPATARPVAALDPDLALELELERLAADGDAAPESGRRPLWEPVSLADLAGHDEDGHHDDDDGAADEAAWDDDEDWGARRWTLADRDADESRDGGRDEGGDDEDNRVEPAPPAPAPRVSQPVAADDPDDDASRSFDRTIAALRSILDGRGDGARAEEPPVPPVPPPAPAMIPAFSLKDAVESRYDEPDELGRDELDGGEQDGDDGAEPSNDDILGFAIRDPDKAPPPWERVRERDPASVGSEPLDRTIAALRSMVQKAAADRDEDEDGDDRDGGVVTPLFGRSRKPADDLDSDADADDNLEDNGPEDDEAADRHAGADDAFWNRAGTDDAPDKDGAPVPRKSAQEQDMEEALRALRALVEAENDLDEPPTPAWKSDAPTRPEASALPGFKPLPRPAPQRAPDDDEDDEPLDLVPPVPAAELEKVKPEKPASEKPAPEKPRPGAGKRTESNESGKKAAKDDSGTLGKTLAALRNMLELDGKQGR
ncbi:hypothetical protein FBZ83_10237 [Azospirillum brasilense]|uniref:Uncharacterized protein n=2 Tax=Azospirillum brasilense TaxID=192 RepID=A0A560CN22_AZOBR|nr:hypothetical protein FBZ83_10237 [Azospirillum brasilense]